MVVSHRQQQWLVLFPGTSLKAQTPWPKDDSAEMIRTWTATRSLFWNTFPWELGWAMPRETDDVLKNMKTSNEITSASLLSFNFRGRHGQPKVAIESSNCGPETKLRTQQKNSSPYQGMIQTEIFITWDWKMKKAWLSFCGRGCRTRKVEAASKVFFSSKCLVDILSWTQFIWKDFNRLFSETITNHNSSCAGSHV